MSDELVLLGHGGGGRLSHELIRNEILPRFARRSGAPLATLGDGASLTTQGQALAFSTDGFVVDPLEFPGGSIGDLAVHGTVNDVACCGARPRWLSLGMILEEGLPIATLRRVLDAVVRAAETCGVEIVTGDTKVVGRGQASGMYLHTAGIGERLPGFDLDASKIRVGDVVLVSGSLGDHGMAVMAARAGISGPEAVISDCGPVHRLVLALSEIAQEVRFLRDPTRGGLAAVLNEIVEERSFGVRLQESQVPFGQGARALAEVMGYDLLHSASEGRLVVVCSAAAAERALERLRAWPEGQGAVRVGTITADAGRVILQTSMGGSRLVDMPQGEILPRIC